MDRPDPGVSLPLIKYTFWREESRSLNIVSWWNRFVKILNNLVENNCLRNIPWLTLQFIYLWWINYAKWCISDNFDLFSFFAHGSPGYFLNIPSSKGMENRCVRSSKDIVTGFWYYQKGEEEMTKNVHSQKPSHTNASSRCRWRTVFIIH